MAEEINTATQEQEQESQITTMDIIKELMPIIGEKERILNENRDIAKEGKIPFIVTVDTIDDELKPRHIHGLLAFLVENRNPIVIHLIQTNHGLVDNVFVNFATDFELLMKKMSKQLVVLSCNIALDELKGESRFGNLIAIGNYENANKENMGFSIICDSPDKVMNDYLTLVSAFEHDPNFKDKGDFMEVAAKQEIDLFHRGVFFKTTTIKELVMGPQKKESEESGNSKADSP